MGPTASAREPTHSKTDSWEGAFLFLLESIEHIAHMIGCDSPSPSQTLAYFQHDGVQKWLDITANSTRDAGNSDKGYEKSMSKNVSAGVYETNRKNVRRASQNTLKGKPSSYAASVLCMLLGRRRRGRG